MIRLFVGLCLWAGLPQSVPFAAVVPGPAQADSVPAGKPVPPRAADPDAVPDSLPAEMRLDVSQTIGYLLSANADIGKAREAWLAESDRFRGSFGNFEPNLVGSWQDQESKRPYLLSAQRQKTYTGGIEGLLPSATKYNLGFSFTDLADRFVENAERPSAFTGLTVTQPLLQGLWFGKPVSEILAARAGKQAAYHRYRSTICAALVEALDKYWKLRYAQDKVAFAAKSVAMARELAEDSKVRFRVGMASEIDTIEAGAGLASRLANYYGARMELNAAMTDLKLLLWGRADRVQSSVAAASPLQQPSRSFVDSLRANLDSGKILQRQPDYLEKVSARRRQEVVYDAQRDQCLPELTLKGTWGYQVTAGTSELAWKRFTDDRYLSGSRTYSAGVELKMPLLLNQKERGARSAERHALRQAEIDEANIRNQIQDYLGISLKRLEILVGNAGNAAIVVAYRRNLLDAEMQRQRLGKSDYHKIFEIEEDLTKARISEMENTLEYLSTLGQLRRIAGTLLRDFGLETYAEGAPVLSKALETGQGE